jgi:protein SCO1/2
METLMRQWMCIAAVIAGGGLSMSGGTYAHEGHKSAAAAVAGDYARSVHAYSVPDITLVDRNAKPVRLLDLLATDEPVMLNFIFTTCGAICPTMTTIFSKVPPEMGAKAAKLRLISISIDPENDTPKELKAYASKFKAGPRWDFLTGSVENIVAVQRAFDNYNSDKMSHEPLTLLRPAAGKPWVRIEGFATARELAQEYKKVAAQ